VPIGTAGGTLHVELNHTDPEVLPAGFRTDANDSRILACALNLAAERKLAGRGEVVLVSKDMPLRVKAAAVGLQADEYHALDVVPSGWTGMADLEVASEDVDALFRDGMIDHDAARELPANTGLRLLGGGAAALGRVTADKRVRLVRGDREAFGLHGRSAEQRVALDLLLDPEVGIISLGGRAGTGKSALALCAGLEAVMERQQHRKVVVFRPLYAVGMLPTAKRLQARSALAGICNELRDYFLGLVKLADLYVCRLPDPGVGGFPMQAAVVDPF
jgi:PhoH-like ATPase